jgi:hypothetical protein
LRSVGAILAEEIRIGSRSLDGHYGTIGRLEATTGTIGNTPFAVTALLPNDKMDME